MKLADLLGPLGPLANATVSGGTIRIESLRWVTADGVEVVIGKSGDFAGKPAESLDSDRSSGVCAACLGLAPCLVCDGQGPAEEVGKGDTVRVGNATYGVIRSAEAVIQRLDQARRDDNGARRPAKPVQAQSASAPSKPEPQKKHSHKPTRAEIDQYGPAAPAIAEACAKYLAAGYPTESIARDLRKAAGCSAEEWNVAKFTVRKHPNIEVVGSGLDTRYKARAPAPKPAAKAPAPPPPKAPPRSSSEPDDLPTRAVKWLASQYPVAVHKRHLVEALELRPTEWNDLARLLSRDPRVEVGEDDGSTTYTVTDEAHAALMKGAKA